MYNKVKNLCARKGISVNHLEKDLGFSKGSLCKWDSNNPTINKVKIVADYFQVSLDYFFKEGD